jgi:XTP/dITP diphosphohydrolase
MRLHLASGNAHKAAEFSALAAAAGLPVEIVSARAVGGMPSVVEDTGTFCGNAAKKARALREKLPKNSWVLSDDSGLCVDELGDGPGVESAYYAGPAGDPAANLAKLVERMRGVPTQKRRAHFVCVLVVIDDVGTEHHFEGRSDGTLRNEPVGGFGFGYDPLFVPDGSTKTFAELTDFEKNSVSHRARAWGQLVPWLRDRIA